MSTSSDSKDVLRRRSVTSQAEFSVEATTASMAIRAVARRPDLKLAPNPLAALISILKRINQAAEYRAAGHLQDLIDQNQIATETAEPVQVMARAARDEQAGAVDATEVGFPRLDFLIGLSKSISIDADSGTVILVVPGEAQLLAEALNDLGGDVLNEAVEEDRKRTPNYAFL